MKKKHASPIKHDQFTAHYFGPRFKATRELVLSSVLEKTLKKTLEKIRVYFFRFFSVSPFQYFFIYFLIFSPLDFMIFRFVSRRCLI